ncbi:adhesion G-protein coupled receptor G5-like isoform X2 [Centroberyx affinis]|uniref:adhesion G-protein coupled receptor G5-like isoform X2 n=1 Tax=Centroberyx affinis TaxID=166261 RepID=UPI003A5C3FE4
MGEGRRQPQRSSPAPSSVSGSNWTSYATQTPTIQQILCKDVLQHCLGTAMWTRCYELKIATCTPRMPRGPPLPNFIHRMVNSSHEAEERPTLQHRVHIPSSALQRSRGAAQAGSEEDVQLVITVLDSSLFTVSPPPPPPKGRLGKLDRSFRVSGTVMGQLVLSVRVGHHKLSNLSQPIRLSFKHNKQADNGTCVFWEESAEENGTGHWSREGCDTAYSADEFICSCNHLSFFAVLVNPSIEVDPTNAVNLTYITYTGSALSVIFTIVSLVIYICLQRRRPEKAIGVHMQLTGALLCLHLGFLLCGLWPWLEDENVPGWVCQALGLLLHWSLLATFSWTALEGFHLYLLLVRVFNIYVRRYLLKLSVVGWGLPTVIVAVCGIVGVYGKYSVDVKDATNNTSAAQMCWISKDFSLVTHITVVGYLGLVLLYNSSMLLVVVVKMWKMRESTRGASGGREGSGGWKTMYREKRARLWKDCATLLGLSCVLGLPWGLAGSTYFSVSLPGLYLFTICNSLQGVFMFLWSLALTCKSRSDRNSSVKDPSTQKMMETSFNN